MVEYTFFFGLVQIVTAAVIVSLILRKLRQPNLFAYIIAGILIGPLFLGGIDFGWLKLPFSIGINSITPEIQLLSELGVAFLLFSIGIETSILNLFRSGKPLIIGTIIQSIGVIFITIILTSFTGLLPINSAIFIGSIIAFSSTMIVVKLLADAKQTNTLTGRITISILLIQDFLVIIIVPLLKDLSAILHPAFFAPIILKIILLVLIAFIGNKYVFPKLFNLASKENELFFLSSISTAMLFISTSFVLDIPVSVGAFIGGLALSNLPYNTAVFSKIRALRDFFMTIFFVSLGAGLSFQFGLISPQLVIIILLLLFFLKPLVFFAMGLLSGYGSHTSLEIGLILSQASEFGFVIAAIGLKNGALNQDLFSFIVTTIAFSMIITPHLMTNSSRIANFFSAKLNHFFNISKIDFFNRKINDLRIMPKAKEHGKKIIVIGAGLNGRRLSRKLRIGNNIALVDSDPEIVQQGQLEGLPIIYGTADDEELLDQLAIDKSDLIIITIPSHKEAINFVKAIKKNYPKSIIICTASHFYDAMDFYENQVDLVSMTNIVGINDLYNKIIVFTKTRKLFVNKKARDAHLKYIRDESNEELKYKKKLMS